ncbi:GatB/YqeY domain-containing protein, partial [Candidatus Peregrinibacteria bacterium]|nr:GatB/YqeY domain-containing protein [Candidatus Peregrinibacteria bacterium]
PQMSEDEVKQVVLEVMNETGATSKADIGKVMGPVMAKVKGLADGGMVNKIVGSLLK